MSTDSSPSTPKIVYLDQNHWIALANGALGRPSRGDTARVVDVLRDARATGRNCLPLSLGHYIETLKQRSPDRRRRLAAFMLELSGGVTVAPPHIVLRHEIERALEHYFPDRVTPGTLEFLGLGLSHAADHDFSFQLDWPAEALSIPPAVRARLEEEFLHMAADAFLSGVLPTGEQLTSAALTDLSPERRFRDGLESWRGAAARYSPEALEKKICTITLADIENDLREVLARHGIPLEDFVGLGEREWCAFLKQLPSRRADMHLRQQWAKNVGLRPKESDLNDWAYLGVAVSYCDIVATEKQILDLFSRGFVCRATILAHVDRLTELLV